jgi:hypothetical protein
VKRILFKIHAVLATISMRTTVHSSNLCDEVNELLEEIYKYSDGEKEVRNQILEEAAKQADCKYRDCCGETARSIAKSIRKLKRRKK